MNLTTTEKRTLLKEAINGIVSQARLHFPPDYSNVHNPFHYSDELLQNALAEILHERRTTGLPKSGGLEA